VQLELIIFEPANPVFEFDPSFACSEVTASFTNHSDPVLNSSMRWIFENPFEQIDQDTLPLNFTRHFPANTDTLVHVYPFSLLATRPGNSCPVVKHDTIRIYPELNADFEIMIDTLAQRLDVTLTSKSTGNITELNWSSGNGEFSTLPAPVFTYNYFYGTDTVYTISLEAVSADGCIQTTHIMLPVFREHVVVLTADNLRGCSPFTSVVTAFGAEHADSVFWEVHRLDGSIDFYKDSMSLHLDLVSLSGQADSVYVVIHTCHNLEWSQTGVYVTVYPEVLAYVNSDQQQGCTPLYIRFTNLSTGADSVFWDFGNSTNSYQDNPWVTYTNTSNETKHIIFTLIASNQHGCADTATGEITVFPKLTTHIELTDIAACSSLSSVLSGAANISAGSMNWFAWYPDHSDSIVTGIDGIYMLQHENTGNTIDTIPIVLLPFSDEACYESADTFVVVYPWVMAAFDLQKAGDDYPVTITTVNQSLNAGEYLWDMGDGTTAYDENLTYSYYAENDTVYSIMLIATGGQCSDTAFGTVEVNVPTALPDVAAENGSTEIYYHHPDSRLTIRHSGVSVELSGVSIVSTTGAKMYEFSIDQVLTEGTELDISLTGLPSGQLYIVILIIDNRYVVRKISRP
jgi:PKD repeat protein